jgi:hypothetical protein
MADAGKPAATKAEPKPVAQVYAHAEPEDVVKPPAHAPPAQPPQQGYPVQHQARRPLRARRRVLQGPKRRRARPRGL